MRTQPMSHIYVDSERLLIHYGAPPKELLDLPCPHVTRRHRQMTDVAHTKTFLTVTALTLFALPSFAQSSTPQAPCTAYFGVLQYDPKVPGLFVAAMSSSQAKWLAKNGQKHYPGWCLSLEKAKYLIVWSIATQVTTTEHTVQRTARANTSTSGSERGTFDTYGALSTWGRYSGSFSSDSTSTFTYDEVVPVTTATDHCYIYILKSVGATVWEDVRNKTSQPRAIFSGEALRPRPGSMESDPSGTAHIGYLFGKEPTAHALDGELKFIFEHGAQTMPVAAFMPSEEKSGDQVGATTQPEQNQVVTTAETTPAKQKAIEQMREGANAIKQCPAAVDRMSPPNSQCFSTETQAGPPLNVTWDVVEKRTARPVSGLC